MAKRSNLWFLGLTLQLKTFTPKTEEVIEDWSDQLPAETIWNGSNPAVDVWGGDNPASDTWTDQINT